MENPEIERKQKRTADTVLIIQFIICGLILVCVWLNVKTDSAMGRFIKEEYSSLMSDDINIEEYEDALSDAAEYVRAFSDGIIDNRADVKPDTEAPTGGADMNISDISALEGVSFDKYETGSDIVCPVDDYYISSPFGYRENPLSDGWGIHTGIDMASSYGSDVYAAYDGTVRKTDYSDGYGNYIVITHENGYETLYAHCSQITAEAGDTVYAGDCIAKVGSTGNSTGNHLHFEIRLNGIKLDPAYALGL